MACKNIGVIGRFLRNKKWDIIYEVLDSAAEAGIEYEIIDIADAPLVNEGRFDGVIWLATKDKCWEIPSLHFTTSSTEADMVGGMQELANKLMGDEEDDTVPETDMVYTPDEFLSHGLVDKSPDLPGVSTTLEALVVEIEGKTVTLTMQDAIRLKEMLSVMDRFGYKIKDVIIGDKSGDDGPPF